MWKLNTHKMKKNEGLNMNDVDWGCVRGRTEERKKKGSTWRSFKD